MTLYARVGRAWSFKYKFRQGDNPYPINTFSFEWFLKEHKDSPDKLIRMTVGSGLTISGDDLNEIVVNFTEAQANLLKEHTYHSELVNTTLVQTWFNGPFIAHNGSFDAGTDGDLIVGQINLGDVVGDIQISIADVPPLQNVLQKGNDAGGVSIKNLADPADPQDAATKAFVLQELTALGRPRGGLDASSGAVPGPSADIEEGDFWRIMVAGTIGTMVLKPGDVLFAAVDDAAVAADFFAVQSNVDLATDVTLGLIKLYSDLNNSNVDGAPSQSAVKSVTDELRNKLNVGGMGLA